MTAPKNMVSLRGRRVLVTGATGFIGGRLAEKLILEHEAQVLALTRTYSRAARLARFELDLLPGSLLDETALADAVDGVDTVFHLAYDWKLSIDDNLKGIRNLADACIKSGVRRFVHVSSIAVYLPMTDGDVTEDSPAEPCGSDYADQKLAIEQEVLRLTREHGLPAVVLQPTNVYGPFGPSWTDIPLNQMLTGTMVLPNNGEGYCNAVYVDDVADAMILAATKANLIGERFIISAAEPVTWQQFYESYQTALGVESIEYKDFAEIEKTNKSVVGNAKLLLANPKRIAQWGPARSLLLKVKDALGDQTKQRLKGLYQLYTKVAPRPIFLPSGEALAYYVSKSNCKIDWARKTLGYNPKFDLETGMALTSEYIKWAYRR